MPLVMLPIISEAMFETRDVVNLKGMEHHQKIRNFEKNKKTSNSERLLICNNTMAGHVAQNWNTNYPGLIDMYLQLVELDSQFGE